MEVTNMDNWMGEEKKMAKVSIIIPTYNVEMYLEECMESVVNQT